MDKHKIISSLQRWEDIRKDSQKLVSYLNQGNCFSFTKKQDDKLNYMHAYLGIDEGKLKMFVIPSEYDNKDTADIAKYVEVCDVFPSSKPIIHPMSNPDNISSETAIRRTDRWDKDYTEWVPKKVSTTEGIFKAFAIPTEDFVTPEVKVHFALRDDAGQPLGYNADMIVICKEEKKIYEDYATPVPPYKPDITKESFYLLSQVK